MIQELSIKNFRSFKDEVTLNFEASKDYNYEDSQVVKMSDGTRILRFIVFFGSNASGKSNLLEAVEFLRNFLSHKPKDADVPIKVEPFMLDKETKDQPSEFKVRFYSGGLRFMYTLTVDKKYVYEEQLFVYTSNQPTTLFIRKLEDNKSIVKFNASLKISDLAVQEIELRCLKNTSLLAVINTVNTSFGNIEVARDEFRDHVMPIISPLSQMLDFAEREMVDNEKLQKYLLTFVKEADFNITNIHVEKKEETIPDNFKKMLLSSSDLPEEAKKDIQGRKFFETINAFFEHRVVNGRGEESYILSDEQQSRGTQRVLGLEAAINEAAKENDFVFVDEIENSLNPLLLDFVLQKYLSVYSQSQLLVTTHFDMLLNRTDKYIRKDSIWFTEKQKDGSTKIYSLKNVRGVNKMRNLQKRYEEGSLVDAYPHIN